MQILLHIFSYRVLVISSICMMGNRLHCKPRLYKSYCWVLFNISKCKYWYIKLLVFYQYPRSGSWLIGIRYLNIVTFRQYLKFRNSVSNRSFWPCFHHRSVWKMIIELSMFNTDSQLLASFKTPLFKEKKEIISFLVSLENMFLGLNYFFLCVPCSTVRGRGEPWVIGWCRNIRRLQLLSNKRIWQPVPSLIRKYL